MIRYSWPSILISVPEYLPYRILSPGFDVHGDELAVITDFAFAGGDDFAFLGLFLGGVRNDEPRADFVLLLDRFYEHAVSQRP